MSKELGVLVVVVLKARNLHDRHTLYKQDVYAQVALADKTRATKVDLKGGQHPVWDEELRFRVPAGASTKNRTMEVSCWSKEPRSAECIGKGKLDVIDTLQKGEFDDWVKLELDGVYRGEVYLEMTFFAAGPPPNLHRRPSKLPTSERLARPNHAYLHSPQRSPLEAPPKTPPKSLSPGRSPPSARTELQHLPVVHKSPSGHLAPPVSAHSPVNYQDHPLPPLPDESAPERIPTILRPGRPSGSRAASQSPHRLSSLDELPTPFPSSPPPVPAALTAGPAHLPREVHHAQPVAGYDPLAQGRVSVSSYPAYPDQSALFAPPTTSYVPPPVNYGSPPRYLPPAANYGSPSTSYAPPPQPQPRTGSPRGSPASPPRSRRPASASFASLSPVPGTYASPPPALQPDYGRYTDAPTPSPANAYLAPAVDLILADEHLLEPPPPPFDMPMPYPDDLGPPASPPVEPLHLHPRHRRPSQSPSPTPVPPLPAAPVAVPSPTPESHKVRVRSQEDADELLAMKLEQEEEEKQRQLAGQEESDFELARKLDLELNPGTDEGEPRSEGIAVEGGKAEVAVSMPGACPALSCHCHEEHISALDSYCLMCR